MRVSAIYLPSSNVYPVSGRVVAWPEASKPLMMVALGALVLSAGSVGLVMTSRANLPYVAQSICAVPGSSGDFYIVTAGEKEIALVRVSATYGTAKVLRTASSSKDGPYWTAKEPGLIQVFEREGENSAYTYVDAETGNIVYGRTLFPSNTIASFDPNQFSTPQLPLEVFSIPGGGRIRLFWDTPKRRLGYSDYGDVVEFKPRTWQQISKGKRPSTQVRSWLQFIGNPELGPFALVFYHEGMNTEAASASWYGKDLRPLKLPYGWVFDIGPAGALVGKSADGDSDITNHRPAVDLRLIDPLTGRVKWLRKEQGYARWVGAYVLFAPPHIWFAEAANFRVLDGQSGKTLAAHHFGGKARLLQISDGRLFISRPDPPALEVWQVRKR